MIGCDFIYSLFNILHTYNQCYNFCLPAIVFTVYCLISIETNCVFIVRGWVLNPLQGEYSEILPLETGLVNATPLARMHT